MCVLAIIACVSTELAFHWLHVYKGSWQICVSFALECVDNMEK